MKLHQVQVILLCYKWWRVIHLSCDSYRRSGHWELHIGMVLTVPYCKTAAVCVALWLLLVIEFTSARIAYCMFRSAVNPLQNSDILKPKCRTHYRKEQMILPKCTTQQCATHCTWSTKLVVTLIKLPKASVLQAPCYRSQKFAHTFHTGLDLLSFLIPYSWPFVLKCTILLTSCPFMCYNYTNRLWPKSFEIFDLMAKCVNERKPHSS